MPLGARSESLPDDADRWFNEYLEHNELRLAFDVLVERASVADANGHYWSSLSRAVDEMCLDLDDEIVRLVKRHSR